MAFLHVLDPIFGDKKIVWSEGDKDGLTKAREKFKELLNKGWLAFKLDPKNPQKGKQLQRFDSKADKIILTPPPGGG